MSLVLVSYNQKKKSTTYKRQTLICVAELLTSCCPLLNSDLREEARSMWSSHHDSASTNVSSASNCGTGVGGSGGGRPTLHTKTVNHLRMFATVLNRFPMLLKMPLVA